MRKRYIILVSLVVGGMIGYAAGQPSATDTRIVNAFWDELRAEQEAERAAARAREPNYDAAASAAEGRSAVGSVVSGALAASSLEANDMPPAAKAPVGRALVDIPGTRRYAERQKALAQQGFLANVIDGMESTTAVSLYRKIEDEGVLGLFGYRPEGTPYDKDEAIKQADPRIDRHMMADILDEETLEAATRSHQRYVEELDRAWRISQQAAGAGLAVTVGSLIVNLPLALVFGGALVLVLSAAWRALHAA